SADYTFTTAPAPIPTGITVSSITNTSAVISWTTSVPSSTWIEYGTSASLGSNTDLQQNLVTSHTQTLTGLQLGTVYSYRVTSISAPGASSTSSTLTFTTLNIPGISNVVI